MDLTESSIVNVPRRVLAVDPGLSGAVFCIGLGAFTGRRDFRVPADIALAVKDALSEAPAPTFAVVEAVHAFPKQGVCSVWSFSEATAYAKAALCLCAPPGFRAREVPPQTWQGFFRKAGLARGEFDSRQICQKLFPSYPQYFTRKLDHNSGDSVLIGVWGLMNFGEV